MRYSRDYRHSRRSSHSWGSFSSNYILIIFTFLKSKEGLNPLMLYIRNQQLRACLLVYYVLRTKDIYYLNGCILNDYISTYIISLTLPIDLQNQKYLLAGSLEEKFAELRPIVLITVKVPGYPLSFEQIFLISLNLQFNNCFHISMALAKSPKISVIFLTF